MRPWLTGVLALLLTGCGYHLAGENVGLPSDVRSLHVGTITNRSSEHGIEKILGFAIEREIHMRRQFRVRTDVGATDAVLTGIVTGFSERPVTFGGEGRGREYEIQISADMQFSRPGAEEPIWARSGYRFRETYEIDISAADYFDRSDLAIREVAEKFAQVIVIDLLEGF